MFEVGNFNVLIMIIVVLKMLFSFYKELKIVPQTAKPSKSHIVLNRLFVLVRKRRI